MNFDFKDIDVIYEKYILVFLIEDRESVKKEILELLFQRFGGEDYFFGKVYGIVYLLLLVVFLYFLYLIVNKFLDVLKQYMNMNNEDYFDVFYLVLEQKFYDDKLIFDDVCDLIIYFNRMRINNIRCV